MPNFIANSIKELSFPFKKDGVEFLWMAKGRNLDLIYTKSLGDEFFISYKNRGNSHLFKAEKLTKPAQNSPVQKALEVLSEEFATDIKSSAFCFKQSKKIQENSIICKELEIIEKIENCEFEKIYIEIGFGSGRHLLYRASTEKDALVIGIEIYKPAIEQVAKLALKQGLNNVLIINTDARVLLSLIKPKSIDKIFLHFPVPWDDAPHRRVVGDEFVKECVSALKNGAKFELRSDSREYSEFTICKFMSASNAKIEIFKNRDLEISSKYEDRWKRLNKDIFDVIFTNNNDESFSNKFEKMEFSQLDPGKIYNKFENKTYKFDEFFIHFEEKYKINDENIILKISFGSFDWPTHCYIKISSNESGYFLSSPLPTQKNIMAHKKIEEILRSW